MRSSTRSGQSLLEMLIALSLLTIAFLGIATLLSRSFFLNRVATDETIGSYLAAEGVEVTKSIIDNDVYGYDPTTGAKLEWGDCCAAGQSYSVQYDSASLSLSNANAYLKLDPVTHFYEYTGSGPTTPFKREIVITTPNADEIDVQSIVSWSTGPLTTETITDEDHFYDWHPH